MKIFRTMALAAALIAPTANAQSSGLETIFNDALGVICSSGGVLASIPVAGMGFEIPGLTDFGLDVRPLCQYADIVGKGTKVLKDVRNGTLSTTERFINQTLSSLAASLGQRLDVDTANTVIEDLSAELQRALGAGDGFLGAYREATGAAIDRIREGSTTNLEDEQRQAQTTVQSAEKPSDVDPATRRKSNILNIGVESDINEAQLDITRQEFELGALTDAASQLLEEQTSNNAYQQTISDTIDTEMRPGGRSGTAERAVQDAQKSTSVRQAINVLTGAIADQLRNDAVFSGAIIENLQANARQQAITNHQLQILTTNILAQQEQELREAENEVLAAMEEAQTELVQDIGDLVRTVEEAKRITGSEAMREMDFSFCGLFPGQC